MFTCGEEGLEVAEEAEEDGSGDADHGISGKDADEAGAGGHAVEGVDEGGFASIFISDEAEDESAEGFNDDAEEGECVGDYGGVKSLEIGEEEGDEKGGEEVIEVFIVELEGIADEGGPGGFQMGEGGGVGGFIGKCEGLVGHGELVFCSPKGGIMAFTETPFGSVICIRFGGLK